MTRPEIYFGELTNTDVYVKTRQKEFNYPQGETNSLTVVRGHGRHRPRRRSLRRLLIALDRGDLAKLPFSDDVTADSRLLMRRNIRERVGDARAVPHLRPRSLHRRRRRRPAVLDDGRVHHVGHVSRTRGTTGSGDDAGQLPAQQRQGGRRRLRRHRRRSTSSTRPIRSSPPIAACFPSLFKDAAAMPADLRAHVRYPELLLKLQAAVYGLYHMTRSRGVLQPRGPVERGERGDAEREPRAGDAADRAELRADEAARREAHRSSSRSCRSRRRTATT